MVPLMGRWEVAPDPWVTERRVGDVRVALNHYPHEQRLTLSGRHLFLGDNNVTSYVFRIPVDPGLTGLVANVRPISVVCFLLDPYRVWFGSVLVFSLLDTSNVLASIDEDVYC
ncbi:hypothetical protein Taro_021633 [Colocasia esculenta]|uniref:Uncharacterized protein n=1 Tax=Colocasia esculenta TaxID=4460 RepID=A0A843UZD8_COLES|nr:hypothetical protein [Colocasia esculenta]